MFHGKKDKSGSVAGDTSDEIELKQMRRKFVRDDVYWRNDDDDDDDDDDGYIGKLRVPLIDWFIGCFIYWFVGWLIEWLFMIPFTCF